MRYASIIQSLTDRPAPPAPAAAPIAEMPEPKAAVAPQAEPALLRDDPNIAATIEVIDEIVAQTSLIAMNAALDSCDPFPGPADTGDDDPFGLLPQNGQGA